MPGITGNKGGTRFRSMPGRGQWVLCNTTAGAPGVGAENNLQIPRSLASDFNSRGWHGAVPALGIRVRGTINSDFAVGANTLKCTKHQRGTHFDMMINNKLQKPYSQTRHDLTRMAYIGMLVNPVAELLDQWFEDDGVGPVEGITPKGYLAPDIGIAGSDAKPFIGDNEANYPALDVFDSFWRQLEGQVPIRTNGAATTVTNFDDFWSIPLCSLKGGLEADSIPLDTLCDLDQPWEVSVRYIRALATDFAADGTGAGTVTSISLYLYVIPQRANQDPRKHGCPYIIRQQPRAQSPLQYLAGEVVLFSGNLPITQDTTRVDTVDAVAYRPGVTHIDVSRDLAPGNTLDWMLGGGEPANFPYWFKDRSPSHVYRELANARRSYHKTRYQRFTGAGPNPVVRAGRALAGLDYANLVDADKLSTLLGSINPFPVRILALTALEMDGFPGFGSLDKGCAPPFIELTGSVPFAGGISDINSPQNMFDVIRNTDPVDMALIEDLGRNCCKTGEVKFVPTVANPESPKANIVAGKLTNFEQVMPADPAGLNAGQLLNTVGAPGKK